MNKQEINILKKCSSDRILDLLDIMGIKYFHNDPEIRSVCPIHHGDNPVAWSWSFFHASWKCWTRNCHDECGTDIIGLIRGIKQCSFKEALEFLSDFTNGSINSSERKITPRVNQKPGMNLSLSEVISRIKLDDQYYINRGLSHEIIKRYHIGICDNRNKKFYKRVVIPILSENGKCVVGFTARSIFNQCNKCKGYHDPNYRYCPSRPELFSKWKHSSGFARNNFLYNYWFSQHYIRQSQTAILVEGPGDSLILEQNGIHNSVALFGLSLSSKQKSLLQKAGAVRIILCMDNDEAGQKATKKLKKELDYYFKVSTVSLCAKDIGEMKPENIRSILCLTN